MMRVFIIASLTLDGCIAATKDQSSLNWTSKVDTKFFVEQTKAAKVVIMGSTTFAMINRPLKGRLIIVCTRSEQKIKEIAAQFDPSEVRATSLEPKALISELEREGFSQVAICGGAHTYTTYMQAGVVTELFLTIEPILFGTGIRLFDDAVTSRLHLEEIIDLSDQVKVLHYSVVKTSEESNNEG